MCIVKYDELFVMNFIIFVLSKFRTKLSAANHLVEESHLHIFSTI